MGATKSWNRHEGSVFHTVNGFDIIDCTRCGFKHAIPIPSEAELDDFYRTKFYTGNKEDYAERQRQDLDWWDMVYAERFQRLEQFSGRMTGRLIDVGAGPGFFMSHGRSRNWDVMGIEPSLQAAEHARSLGLHVVNASLGPEHAAALWQFDVLHMQGVMEHVRDPHSFLDICQGLLRPGGLLCTVVANDYNPFQQVLVEHLGFRPWWLVPPEHINYFSISSLRHLLERCGFEFVHVITTFPIDMFLLMGANYVGNDVVGRDCHGKRKQLEFALTRAGKTELKNDLYRCFAQHNLGRDIEMIVRKKAT